LIDTKNFTLISLGSKKDTVARQVDLPPKRPDKDLYSPPNIKLRNDFMSTDFFAEEANRNSEDRQHPVFDVPDRSNHKRFWASSDDWGSFRSGQDQSWMSVDDRFVNEKGSTGSGKFKSSFIWTRGSDFLNSRDKRSQNSNHQVIFYVEIIYR
jgi:hypothetical protein